MFHAGVCSMLIKGGTRGPWRGYACAIRALLCVLSSTEVTKLLSLNSASSINSMSGGKETNHIIRIEENTLINSTSLYISILCLDARILPLTSTLHEINLQFSFLLL